MQINIPAHAEEWLQQRAEQFGFESVEQYVLAVVLPKQQTQPYHNGVSFFDAATEAGLIGGGSEYAKDLSSNPDHMQGFGRQPNKIDHQQLGNKYLY